MNSWGAQEESFGGNIPPEVTNPPKASSYSCVSMSSSCVIRFIHKEDGRRADRKNVSERVNLWHLR